MLLAVTRLSCLFLINVIINIPVIKGLDVIGGPNILRLTEHVDQLNIHVFRGNNLSILNVLVSALPCGWVTIHMTDGVILLIIVVAYICKWNKQPFPRYSLF